MTKVPGYDKKNSTIKNILILIPLLLLTASALFPFYFMIVSSLKTKEDYFMKMAEPPLKPYFENVLALFDRFDIVKMLSNSMLVNIIALAAIIVIVTMAGFIFAKFPFKFSNTIYNFLVACMMVPLIILMIPIYTIMSKLGLINNYMSLILFYVASTIPFSIYLVTTNFRSVPSEVLESVQIDGGGLFTIYKSIMLPLGKPVILTVITLNFLYFWNEFLYSMLFLNDPKMRTLTVGVVTLVGKFTTNMPMMLAGLFINCLPVLVVFFLSQKYFIKGLVSGAIK